MSIFEKKRQVLNILVENLKNREPKPVHSRSISEKVGMSFKDTCQLIKILDQKGLLKSDQDGELSLITREGMNFLKGIAYRRAA